MSTDRFVDETMKMWREARPETRTRAPTAEDAVRLQNRLQEVKEKCERWERVATAKQATIDTQRAEIAASATEAARLKESLRQAAESRDGWERVATELQGKLDEARARLEASELERFRRESRAEVMESQLKAKGRRAREKSLEKIADERAELYRQESKRADGLAERVAALQTAVEAQTQRAEAAERQAKEATASRDMERLNYEQCAEALRKCDARGAEARRAFRLALAVALGVFQCAAMALMALGESAPKSLDAAAKRARNARLWLRKARAPMRQLGRDKSARSVIEELQRTEGATPSWLTGTVGAALVGGIVGMLGAWMLYRGTKAGAAPKAAGG
jgi:chromosome segregation ATPase